MNWAEFKEVVDLHLQARNIEGNEVEINWIDIGMSEINQVDISTTQGSDGRMEIQISD
jgi:hypothetical protein